MQTTVTTLLRDFPAIRRAAFAGERIVVKTREGNLVITAEKADGSALFGCLKGSVKIHGDIVRRTSEPAEWGANG